MVEKKDLLETVRVISDALAPFTDDERERILRFSCEMAGVPAFKSQSSQTLPVLNPQVQQSTPFSTGAEQATSSTKDIKSFVQGRNPRSDVQFAAVAAYFYRFEAKESEMKETINAEDLQNAGRQARGYGFKDALKTLNNAESLGYFNRSGRGTFTLNAVGENLVAMVLPGSADSTRISRKSNVKKKVKKSATSKK